MALVRSELLDCNTWFFLFISCIVCICIFLGGSCIKAVSWLQGCAACRIDNVIISIEASMVMLLATPKGGKLEIRSDQASSQGPECAICWNVLRFNFYSESADFDLGLPRSPSIILWPTPLRRV